MYGRRGVWGVLGVATLAIAMVFAFASSAFAAERNPECLSCHTSMGQDWSVADVDRNTACVKCHTPGLAGTHPYHNGGGNCGAVCHTGWGASLLTAVPQYTGAAGSFATSESVNTSSGALHIIHSTPRWPAGLSVGSSKCASCHERAACDACHEGVTDPPSPNHQIHSSTGDSFMTSIPVGYNPQPTMTDNVAYGVIGEDQTIDSVVSSTNMCGTAGCHDVAGMTADTPLVAEDFSHPAYPDQGYPAPNTVTTTGSWGVKYGAAYSGGRSSYSNQNGATLEVSFTGNYFEVVAETDPYRGQAEVYIDNVLSGTFDSYSPTTKRGQIVYRSPALTTGAHTIRVRVLGTQHASARAAWVMLDGFRVYASAGDSVAPKCDSCHPDRTASHGYTFAHVASSTVGTYGGFACNQCHQLAMVPEHQRLSAKTSSGGSVCGKCHTTYAPYVLDNYNYTCYGTGAVIGGAPQPCHVGAATRHNAVDTTHTPTADATEAKCRSCHPGNLDVIHTNSVTTNAVVTDCLDCHGPTLAPATKSCTGGCHVTTGVDSMESHPYVSPSHEASASNPGTATSTGGLACGTVGCHDLELKPEHVDKSASTVGGAAFDCGGCHDQTYLPKPWNDQCNQCHVAGKAPVAHNAFAAKHDYNAYAVANTASCGGANCHDVTLADVLHNTNAADGSNSGGCAACHNAANTASTGVPTKKLCTDCHSSHNLSTPHQSGAFPASTECLRCHDGFNDINTAHPSCATCHQSPVLTDYLQFNYTAACTDCHASGAGKLGTVYTPADPNHYVGTETTHTASSQTGQESGFNCNQCHSLEMKPEHIAKTKTNFVGVPATYPDKCVACHEQRVDTLPGGVWNKTCDQCHATKHTAKATQHNATNTNLSGVLATTTVFTDSFESTIAAANWTNSNWVAVTGTGTAGTWAAANVTTTVATERYIQRAQDVSAAALSSATVSFSYKTATLAGGTDYLRFYTGTSASGPWHLQSVRTTTSSTWTTVTASLPATTTWIRFASSTNAATERVFVDNVIVSGLQRGASPGTAGANCAGSGCHNVADVSAIHNNSIPTNSMNPTCLTCHNPTPVTPVKDCNASGCHNGGHNMAVHTTDNSVECVNCHETNNVQAVHPTCDTCHANPTYPGIVTGNTAQCVSCHNAGEVGGHLYSPIDPNHYTGTETTHTSSGNGTYNSYNCVTCHQLEMKPEHAKVSASFAGTTTVGGKCTVCHETKVDSFVSAWDKKCASCHPTTHTDRATKHNASAVGVGAQCGGSGCHAVSDVAVIHNNSITTNGLVPTCLTCHTNNTTVAASITCEDAGCHQGMQHGHALDRTNSNYNNTTVTGCTNSGAGCHGDDVAASPDYAISQYHPSNGCQAGTCHTSASQPNAAFNNPQTCQNCHGGRGAAPLNYVGAPDVITLVASSTAPTGGHYGETTHTSGIQVQTAKAKADGLTSATCDTCHQDTNATGIDGLWYQHQVLQGLGNTTCYDCHSNPSYPSVSLEVQNNWTNNACSDCHTVTKMPLYAQHTTNTAPVVLGIVSQTATASPGSCDQGAGCHMNLDLHELHKGDGISGSGRPDPACNVCHDPLKQGWKPTEKSCGDLGVCHITQPHLAIGPAHSVTALSQACIDCHETTDLRINHGYTSTCSDGTNTCHNNPAWPTLPGGRQECVDCHNAGLVGGKDYAPHDNNHYVGTESTHTASAQAGGFGSIYSVVATEGFNAASFPVAWTRSSTTRVLTTATAPFEGTYAAAIGATGTVTVTDYFQRTFDTASVASPTISFNYKTLGFSAPGTATVSYSIENTPTIFTTVFTQTATQSSWTTVGPLAVPRSKTLTIRFSATTNATSERFVVDNFTIKPGDAVAVACNSCHQMEMRPEHFKASSAATRVPSIYPDKCVDCHENKADAFGAAWDHTCMSCHTANHTGQTAKHDATAIAPTCGASGCHYTKDVAVIHNNSATSNATFTTCANTCHTSNLSLPTTLDCGAAACHPGVSAHTHDLDRDGSLFNPTTVTGCVDSGAGCHGNSASTDYTSYHPTSGCLTGPCHTAANHNDPQFNNPNTCMNCHGGGAALYNNATDRIPVDGATPNGHYPETTHTAVASARTASMTAGGTISARCNQCHNDVNAAGVDGLYFQHQALDGGLGNTSCVDCHNYNVGVTAEVTGNWTTDTCSDCHNVTDMPTMTQHAATAPVVLGTEAQGAGSCQTTGCHTTLDLHALHKGSAATPPARAALGCAFTGCHDYTKQGVNPTLKSCGTGGACHTTDSHNPTAHNVVDSANCTRCHEGAGGVAATDIRNVYKSNGFGNVVAHDNCGSCHNAGANLGATNTADCVDCHNATEAGTHAYTPYDPNHYYTTSHDSSGTSTGSWGTGTFGQTLSDYHGTSFNYERACTGCHTVDLQTEHNKTSVAFNLGGEADKCGTCHELKVDNWSARWNGSCSGEANSCHNFGALHDAWGTKHDASAETMTAPGSTFALGASTSIETTGFGTTTTWPTTWTRSNTTYVTVQTGSARSGAAPQIGVNTTRTEYNFYKTAGYALASYGGGKVQFWYQVNVSDTADFLVCEYSTAAGGPYTEAFRVNTDALTWTQSPEIAIPGGATIYVRFRGTFNATGEYGRIDDLTVSGVNGAALGAALPANSNANTACSNNPNGTECHNVADVADIHSRTANNGCPLCHTSTTQHPTNKNCQAAGCHVGINVDNHNTAWHESTIANTSFDAGYNTAWCKGCHDDSIDNEHFVLGAYGSQPCSVCHKKSSDSAAPVSVTSAITSSTIHADATAGNALCTQCHTTVSKGRPHVKRTDASGTVGGPGQFPDTYTGHRVYSSNPGAATNQRINGYQLTNWTLPANATWLKSVAVGGAAAAQLTPTSMIWCSDCHGSVTGATGPHGGAMQIKLATGYDNSYSLGTLYNNAGSMSNTTNICAKCHTTNINFNSAPHGNNHQGTGDGECIDCHIKTPHVWKRPRLIGYTTDPIPYRTTGLTGIAQRASETYNGWAETECGGCGKHTVSGTVWP